MTTLHAVGVAPQPQAIPHQQQQQQQQQTITYQTVQAQPQVGTVINNYSVTGARQTGYAQVTCGVLSVAIGIAAIVMECSISWVASPIWTGIGFFVVAGILGIASSVNQNNCVIVGHLVMSILASLAAFQLMCIMTVAALIEVEDCRYVYNIYGYHSSVCDKDYGRIAVDSIGAIVALAEFIVSIIASVICCRGSCGSGTIATQQTVVHHYVPNQGNVTIMTNPQPYGQPMAPQPGYIQQAHRMPPSSQGYPNQAFSLAPQTSHGALPMSEPPPYNYEDEKAHGLPIAQS